MWRLKTPVAFFIFNRPETTARVFAEIARAKPSRLFVVADGPRTDRPGEAERCAEARAVVEKLDWECEVSTNYSESNLGCKERVSSGIDWVFEHAPEAIILEDDCLPHPSFFRFCDEMLECYRDDARVGMINGCNFQFGRAHVDASYHFSRCVHVWGWATWRRAWRFYDKNATAWPLLRQNDRLAHVFPRVSDYRHWKKIFDRVHRGEIDTWDYQWNLSLWSQSLLCVAPDVNLVSNIGFGKDATHTKIGGITSDMAVEAMRFPLEHPAFVLTDGDAELFEMRHVSPTSPVCRALCKLRGLIVRG
ncbi:MAG: glycosyltransferase family 2 protein [Candidatus Accumulibacter sp.]|jgi:hypothetical protein|nr:glycosyltransferase family 2 protein [Accumulibacter sp.]